MVQDPVPAPRLGRVLLAGLAGGVLLAALTFALALRPRPDLGEALEQLRVLAKFALGLGLATAATGLLGRLARPGVPGGGWRWSFLLPGLCVLVAVAAELVAVPPGAWEARLFGKNAAVCAPLILLISAGPLLCLLAALRHGAPTRPGLAGAVAGVAAGGIAATLYALHCPDDSPLFVAAWYSLAIGADALAGFLIGRRWLRW
nr:DUF1109 domain-containing protein [Pseudoroseomonas coralli]